MAEVGHGSWRQPPNATGPLGLGTVWVTAKRGIHAHVGSTVHTPRRRRGAPTGPRGRRLFRNGRLVGIDHDRPGRPRRDANDGRVGHDGRVKLTILVTNDDGVKAPGINALVEALVKLPDTSVVVAAPAENRSGTGSNTPPGGAPAAPSTTSGGYPATAVSGFPADAVLWALDGGIDAVPQLVVSGINSGQNIGKLVDISGTVGAARAAATKGVPALAVSAGLADQPDFATAARLAVEWIRKRRTDLVSKAAPTPAPVENLNVPSCTAGQVKDVVRVGVDTVTAVQAAPVDCTASGPAPALDVAAFNAGYAPLSVLSVGNAG